MYGHMIYNVEGILHNPIFQMEADEDRSVRRSGGNEDPEID